MARALRLRDGPSGRLRRGEQIARRPRLRSGEIHRLCLRPRHGSARDDPLRHSRHSFVRAERSAFPEAVRVKFSVNWLREFVDLPASVDELADLLTFAGVE